MTDEEKSKELTRSSFAAQMAMLGYEPNGNQKDMAEVVRCKDCIHYRYYGLAEETVSECRIGHCENQHKDWFCADGKLKEGVHE